MKLKVDLSKFKNFGSSADLLNSSKVFRSISSSKSFKKILSYFKTINKKPSKSLKLGVSKRDFILLSILILGLEVYGIYNLFLSSKLQVYNKLKTRYAGDQTIAENFEKDMTQKSKYLDNLKLLDFKLSELSKELPLEIAQEDIVVFLNNLANASKLNIDGLIFSPISTVTKQDFAAGKISSNEATNKGKVTTPSSVRNDINNSKSAASSTNKGSIANGSKIKPASNMVLVEDVDIAFMGNYGALYNFINSLEQSDQRIIVQEVGMVRGNGGLLKGELKIRYVGYTDAENVDVHTLVIPSISGKTSPFLPYPGFADLASVSSIPASASNPIQAQDSAPVKAYNPDFFILINTYDDSAPKIIMRDYIKNGSEIYSNINANVRAKLTISGDQDSMTYSYSLGGTTENKTAKLLLEGGKIQLDVISKARKNEQDKVGLTLDVDNKTNYPLEITVENDDKQAPRFSLGTQSGNVTVK